MSQSPPPSSADDIRSAARVSVQRLACRRGARRLFSNVNFELRSGEVIWIRGRNGRGKTSLLRLVAGISTPEEGRIVRAEAIAGDASSAHSQPLYIGHSNALKDDLTAGEALEFLLRVHGRPHDEASLAAALGRWDMDAQRHAFVRTLSQGQRRRVALARLAAERAPGLWVLDEPFDALDASGVQRLNELLSEHLKRGGSVLTTGHQSALSSALPQRDFDLDSCAH